MKYKDAILRVCTYMFSLLPMTIYAADNVQEVAYSRGIGQYPGSPDEFFGPSLRWDESGDGNLTNVALHRAAWASSARDYNHTAHLVTDGIATAGDPALLTVTTPAGRLPRREAEWTIDGGPYSRGILMGSTTWIRYDWSGGLEVDAAKIRLKGMVAYDDQKATQGYAFRLQTSDDGEHWQTVGLRTGSSLPGTLLHYKLHSDPNKQEAQDYLPARVLDEMVQLDVPVRTQHVRLQLEMAGAAHWDIRELQFLDADNGEVEVLPSHAFSSLWMSEGGGEQWLYVDLGARLPVRQVALDWLYAPQRGAVHLSDDGTTWCTVAELPADAAAGPMLVSLPSSPATARYVRILMTQAGEAGCYALREMKVLSPRQLTYEPYPEAGMRNGRYELSGGAWMLQRASEVEGRGEDISTIGYNCTGWIPATVPGTVLASYINIGAVPNPNYADNVDQISESFFRSNFWYRDEFEVGDIADGEQQWLNFDGINWKAHVFLNGHSLGTIEGAFMRGRFNVTGLLRRGRNCLAVEVVCNEHFAAIKEKDAQSTQFNGGIVGADNPTFHASVGWDWITTVRGREVGIWNEVYLTTTGKVSVSDPYVMTRLDEDGQTASVTPSVYVRNHASQPVTGVLRGHIGEVHFEQTVTLPAQAEREVTFSPASFPQLTSRDFRLWWPNGYGEPYLYDADFTFTPEVGQPSVIHYMAGLREMRYTGLRDSLRIYVNGRRFIPLGGNWGFDEHNLLYRAREYDIAVGYHRDMHFTMIRNWVGQVGDESFYEACDRHGIMIWQDFWLANPADGPDPYDDEMFLANARDYLRRIRRHASIGLYCGRNEGFPPEAIDRRLLHYVHTLSPGMEYISHSSAEGVSGGGPYRALPIREYFERQSGKLHSERGMPNVMNIESLRRTFSADALWPQQVQWGQHDYTLQGAQRASEFNRLVSQGFGEAPDAEAFARWAQLINYNGYRGMFESTSHARAGLLLWMSHPCWPSMVWQTYDYYFEPTAAYFGAKKACEPLHIQYNALTDSIEVVNHSAGRRAGIRVCCTVFDLQGKRAFQRKMSIDSDEDTTLSLLTLSSLMPSAPSEVYFLRLEISDKSGRISENTYILGRTPDNYQALAALPVADVECRTKAEGQGKLTVTLSNRSRVPAPMLRINLKGDDGEQILPVVYSDNYVTLMPGESRTVGITWSPQDSRGTQPRVEVTALNAK